MSLTTSRDSVRTQCNGCAAAAGREEPKPSTEEASGRPTQERSRKPQTCTPRKSSAHESQRRIYSGLMDTQMTHLNTGPVPGLDSFAFFNRRWENQKYLKAVSG